MSNPITFRERLRSLAQVWTEKAQGFEEFDASNPAARALRQCASDLSEVIDADAPRWVTHAQVRIRTGRSESFLYRRYADLAQDGLARKRRGRWEVTYEAALSIPVRASHDPAESVSDPAELAALYMDRADRRAS